MVEGRDLVPGDVLDKYRLERLLGRGGMGEVWAAHDPDLDRKIALKVLTRALAGSDDAQARLQREGRAMARLRHANVITVHDALFRAGRGLIAMELIDGESLATWLIRRRRPDEIMRVVLAAGRGLAAAHRAGMVHRDFKPHNVLIDRDDRVVVTDFGLARATGDTIPPPMQVPLVIPAGVDVNAETISSDVRAGEATGEINAPTPPPVPEHASMWAAVDAGAETLSPIEVAPTAISAPPGTPPPASGSGDLGTPLTQTGALLGTPAYMAPEQLAGKPADARADQFAFCVTAWEAFAGERPFRGKSVEELAKVVQSGVRGATDRVPRRLRLLLARGLAVNPAERWPAMDPLLRALDRAWRRPRRIAIAIGAAVATAAIAVLVVVATRKQPIEGCGDPDAALATAWSPSIRADVERRLADSPARDRVVRFYDRWATTWKATRKKNCAKPKDGDFAVRRTCLESIRDDVAVLMELRASAQPDAFANQELYRTVPAPEACEHDPRGLTPGAPPPALHDEVTKIRVDLATARLALDSLDADVRMIDTTPLVERATRTGYAPVKSEALLIDGIRGMYDPVTDRCEGIAAAVDDADGNGYERLVVEGLTALVECRRSTDGEWETILRRLDAITRRTGHPIQRAEVESLLAGRSYDKGQFDQALEHISTARTTYEAYELTEWTARAIGMEAMIRLHRGHKDDTRAAYDLVAMIPADQPEIDHVFLDHMQFTAAWRLGIDPLPPVPEGMHNVVIRETYPITLTIVDDAGPVAGAAIGAGFQLTTDGVRAAMPETGGVVSGVSGADGTARIEVPPGSLVYARQGDRAGVVLARDAEGPQTIRLAAAGALTGYVGGLEPRPDPGPDDLPGRFAQRALPVALLHYTVDSNHVLTWEVPVDASGTWHASGLVPGEYLLSVQAASFGGDTQSRQATITVAAGAATAPRVEFDPSPKVIEVVRPAGEATDFVILYPGYRFPDGWVELMEALEKADGTSRAHFLEGKPADDILPGQRIARLATSGRGAIVCTLPSAFMLPHMALSLFFTGGPETYPHCAAIITRDPITRWKP